MTMAPDDAMSSPGLRQSAPVLRLEGIAKVYGATPVLSGLDLVITRGETVAVIGHRGSGRSTLAGIATGRLQPGAGRVLRDGPVAPPVGQPCGIGATGRLERDLGLRAVTWGMARAMLVERVLGAIDALPPESRAGPAAEDFLAWRADRLPPPVRQTVLHAAAWAVPAALYVVDGAILPGDAAAAAAVAPLQADAAASAAILWMPPGPAALRRWPVTRALGLQDGRLAPAATTASTGRRRGLRDADGALMTMAARPAARSMVDVARARFATQRPPPAVDPQDGPDDDRRAEGVAGGRAASGGTYCLISLMRGGPSAPAAPASPGSAVRGSRGSRERRRDATP